MQLGDIVDHKTDKLWRGGTIKRIAGDSAYVSWPANEDNGGSVYTPHLISNLALADVQLNLF